MTTRFLTDALDHWADAQPDQVAMKYGERTWTWAQWHDRVRRVSGALQAAGIQRDDSVAFVGKNHPAALEVLLGASAIGAVTAIANWRLSPEELTYVLADSKARLLFVDEESAAAVDQIRDRLGAVKDVIVVTEGGTAGQDQYECWLAAAAPIPRQPDVDDGDTALLIYTSGTTGFPKGAMLTHRGLVAHSRNLSAAFELDPSVDNLVAMPMFHVGGTCYALVGIHNGATSTVLRTADPASIFGAVAGGATHAFLVPAVIAGILGAGDAAIAALSPLKFIGYGASPCPAPVLSAALAAWPSARFIQAYGSTELAGVVSTLSPEAHLDTAHPERLASAGTVLANVELRVVDPLTGSDVAPGDAGELWFRGEQVMAGYWGKPEATAEAVTPDGWYRTGDIGQVDDGGFVYIVDRVKDMIISGGENIYSPEVEQVIAEHPAVAEVAIIGIPHPKWGEEVKAFVAAKPGATIDPDELIAFARTKLAAYKVPRSIEILAELPRNATGKILKRVLRKPYWEGQGRNV